LARSWSEVDEAARKLEPHQEIVEQRWLLWEAASWTVKSRMFGRAVSIGTFGVVAVRGKMDTKDVQSKRNSNRCRSY